MTVAATATLWLQVLRAGVITAPFSAEAPAPPSCHLEGSAHTALIRPAVASRAACLAELAVGAPPAVTTRLIQVDLAELPPFLVGAEPPGAALDALGDAVDALDAHRVGV